MKKIIHISLLALVISFLTHCGGRVRQHGFEYGCYSLCKSNDTDSMKACVKDCTRDQTLAGSEDY